MPDVWEIGSVGALREFQTESNFPYYRGRYYNPTFGRFVSEDPIGFAGGQANLYAYVFNSPTNFGGAAAGAAYGGASAMHGRNCGCS